MRGKIMSKFKVSITEILNRVVEIEAYTMKDAVRLTEDLYHNSDIVLSYDDFVQVTIEEETE